MLAPPHHLGREVGQHRGAGRIQAKDRARGGAGPRAQIEERERILLPERQQAGHEPPLQRTALIALLLFRGPDPDGLGRPPDGSVRVRRVTHEQKAT